MKKILILTVSLLLIASSAFAIKVTLFIDIPTYAKRSKDIVIAKVLEKTIGTKSWGGLHSAKVEIISVLKGTRKIGEAKIATIYYSIESGKTYLLSSMGGSALDADFLAIPELSVVEIRESFDLDQLKDKTLQEQLKIIFRARYDHLKYELRDLEKEKELLEKALNNKNP